MIRDYYAEIGIYVGERLATPANMIYHVQLDRDDTNFRYWVSGIYESEQPANYWQLELSTEVLPPPREFVASDPPAPSEDIAHLITVDGWAGLRATLTCNGQVTARRPVWMYLRPWPVPTVVPMGYRWRNDGIDASRAGLARGERWVPEPITLVMRIDKAA